MKTIGFIGAYDKTDLILYIARLIAQTEKRVLLIDASTLQKTKYMVPTISPANSYVTHFEDIDVAVGLYDYDSIKNYLGMPTHATLEYDYIFLDIDSPEMLERFEVKTATKNYFVSGFDIYSLKRGIEILEGLEEPIPLTKVLYSKNITKEEDNYFNFITLGTKAIWNEEVIIYFPLEQGDQTVIIDNQRVAKIKIKKLSQLYKDSLLYIAEDIIDDEKESSNIRKAFKRLEKGV